jgi:hypothetical protein
VPLESFDRLDLWIESVIDRVHSTGFMCVKILQSNLIGGNKRHRTKKGGLRLLKRDNNNGRKRHNGGGPSN